jgi:hypothetical protein
MLSDTLTSIGQPLRQEEFLAYLLGGLGEEYDALVQVVSAKTTPMPTRDVCAQLLSTENRVETRKAELMDGHSANAAFRPSSSKPSYRPDTRQQNYSKPASIAGNYGRADHAMQMDRAGDRGESGDRPNGNRHVCQM